MSGLRHARAPWDPVGAYAFAMINVPVWVHDWVHECCGETRRVGDTLDLELTFAGDAVADDGPDSVDVLPGGRISIVGAVDGLAGLAEGNHTEGTRIASGGMKFAFTGGSPAARVRCTGELEEVRHGFPSGLTTGLLTGIQWRPAIMRRVDAVSFAVEGYETGQELASTEDRPIEGPENWAFVLTLRIES